MTQATTNIVATFPPGSFVENIVACPGGGCLVTIANMQQLFYIPPYHGVEVTPFLIESFAHDQWTFAVINALHNPNVFYIVTSDFTGVASKTSYLHAIDLGNARTGYRSKVIMKFPEEATGLNGGCALSETVLVVADSWGSCIWRIDLDLLPGVPRYATARLWSSGTMYAGTLVLPDFQPGANGVKYSAKTGCVYFTNTQRKSFFGQRVDPETMDPVGEPEVIATGGRYDDLILDDHHPDGPVAYLTTHRDNTILRVPLTLGDVKATNEATKVMVEGSVENNICLGPTSGTWEVGKEGKVAYFAFDGGLKGRLSDGICRCGRIVQVEF